MPILQGMDMLLLGLPFPEYFGAESKPLVRDLSLQSLGLDEVGDTLVWKLGQARFSNVPSK